MTFKLAIDSIIKETFTYLKQHYKRLFSVLTIPVFFYMLLFLYSSFLPKEVNLFPIIIFWLLLGIASAKFAISCHRLVLENTNYLTRFSISRREVIFIFWATIVYLISTISTSIMLSLITGNPQSEETVINPFFIYLQMLANLYLLARLSLMLPAIAVDKKVSLKWAWNVSKGNGWRLAAIIGFFPILLKFLLSSLLPELSADAPKVLAVFRLGFAYSGYLLTLAFEIIALSFCYKAFESYYITQREQSEENHPSE